MHQGIDQPISLHWRRGAIVPNRQTSLLRQFSRTLSGMLTLLVGLPLVCGQTVETDVPLPDKEHFHLFVLAGQSNMAGRGAVTDEDRKPHARVLMWTQDGRFIPAVDPVHFDKPKMVGVGPGRSFGIAVANEQPEITVGLIPCAVGGSPIDSWMPGGYHDSTKTHPYDDATARIRAASKFGTIKGILWHQGESDSNPSRASAYQAKLSEVLQRMRTAIGAEVPILIGQLGQFPERPWNDSRREVDRAHQQIAQELPNARFVSSTGLLPKSDQIHFNREAAMELGRRFQRAYRVLSQSIAKQNEH